MLAPDVIESAEKRVGQTLGGKWHLDRVIGVGGMAAVYEATHRNRNRVAIKLLHPALSLDEGTRRRFLREGYVANTIRHSGAVQVLDDDTTEDGFAFLVMELLRGESVEERMNRKGGALDPKEALEITEQLLDVLQAAHDQNVVHRDIKPDNIFLTDDGRLKVLDFGIARLNHGTGRTTKVGSFMGTPAFCAQEQARGRWDEVDHRTDLYSVGASLFTCLTGLHVHEAETSSEQLALAIGATARSLADVMPQAPRELVVLVDTALAYDKEERFQSARAMHAAVMRVKAGLPVSPRATTPPPPSGTQTFGSADLDPDSIAPATLLRGHGPQRLVLGVLVAGVLAVLIFLASNPLGSGRVEPGSAVRVDPEIEKPTGATSPPASVSEKVQQDEADTDTKGLEEEEVVVTEAPSKPASAKVTQTAPGIQVSSTKSKPLPPPRPPSPSPSAYPTPAPTLSDEGMFERRF